MITMAKPEDIPQIVALGYNSFDENKLGLTGLAAPSFAKAITNVTTAVMEHLVFVIRNKENDMLIDGVFGLKIGEYTWWSNDTALIGFLFYIKPEKRSFKQAVALVNAAKEYAIINNIPIVSGMFTQKDEDRKNKLLKYLGFKQLGTNLIFRPDLKED